jgi:asparagine synthase (glutamine-hydrolysing)
MCAIVGIIPKSPQHSPDEGLVRRMTGLLAHRGPDGEGIWVKPGVGLGHRRLAIVDLSPTGAQPMSSQDGRFTIVFNGEIYNFRELRAELEAKGVQFRSTSDTEVMLEAYRTWEENCVEHFRGMFAFAIWDNDQKELFFARDRIGKKPFFYRTLADGSVTFASEMKALIPLEPVTIDEGAIRLFIGLQYVPSPRTGFNEIHSLPPGHRGIVRSGEVRTEPYNDWNALRVRDVKNADEQIRSRLEDAVRLRLLADVPVGAFLSGGVDSAAVVALASKHVNRPLRTYTMGFPDIGMDERAEAREIAHAFHTDHQEFEAKPGDLARLAEQVIAQYDAPYADSSALPLMLLAEQTANEVKAVLTGDGGDELFGGYRRYTAYQRALQLAAVPGASGISMSLARIASIVSHDPRLVRMGETIAAGGIDANHAYAELFCGSYFSSAAAKELLQPAFLTQTEKENPISFIVAQMGSSGEPTERALRFDLTSYLPDDLNVKMDRATMAHGLEARSPFLDQEMVAFALGLPVSEKVSGGQTKIALKRALKGIVPDAVLDRPKRGFQVPLAAWFRGPLAAFWKEKCLDPNGPLTRYVRLDAAKKLFEENERGADHGNRLWMLLSLSVWLQRQS